VIELYFLPGGGILMFIFMCFVLACASIAMGGLFFIAGHTLKQWLFKVTPAGKKLRIGMGSEHRGFGKWPWYITDKLPLLLAAIGAVTFFYSFLGPLLHVCGMSEG
jgi:hypothetical protein